jgi:hypothetical protein
LEDLLTAELAAEIGRWMLLMAACVSLLGVLRVMPRLLAVRRRARALQSQAARFQAEIDASLAQLAANRSEMARLWRPWRQVLKWATHPLTLALVQSYRRRWTA